MNDSIHADRSDALDGGTIHVPDVIPVFPLANTVLLPGEVLPLHIFEPRYRAMVTDALSGHRVIGMVQARPPEHGEDIGRADMSPVGCLGLIAQHQELPDGRFLMWLLGVERFRIDEELATPTAYRQVRVHYTPVERSAQSLAGIQPLRQELRQLLPKLVDADESTRQMLARQMDEVTDTQLIALSCQILELGADRKQEVLEAASQTDRFLMIYEDVYQHLELNPEEDGELAPTMLN